MGGGLSGEVGCGPGEGSLEEARRQVDSARSAGPGVVLVAATEILRVAGVPAYHTSVILGDREYYFDSQGIISAPPLWSHFLGQSKRPRAFRTEVIDCGCSVHTGFQLAQCLQPFFEKGSYDVLHKNCNIFTDAALYYLIRRRLDGRFSRLERMLVATEPLSTDVLNRLLVADLPKEATPSTASAGRLWPGPYIVNPLAEHFSVEQVIAACDVLNAAEFGPRSAERAVCGCMLNGWSCVNPSAADVSSHPEEAADAAMNFQAADIVDVDEPVTRPASLLSPNGIEEEPLTPDAVDSRDLEELRYWDFELNEDDGVLEEGAGGLRGCRKVPVQEIVAEAQSTEPRKMEPLRDIGNTPRPGPAWKDRRPLPRGKSLDGALFLEDLAGVSEKTRGAASAELSARRGRVRRSKTIAT